MPRNKRLSERAAAPVPEGAVRHVPGISDVIVEYLDGEVRSFRITASHKIGDYLASRAAETGQLILFNDDESIGVPMSQVRTYTIRPVPVSEPETPEQETEADEQ